MVKETELYDIIGVPPTATPKEISKAYKRKSLVVHPDKPTGDEEEFKKLSGAYEVLSDADKRRQYDQFGKDGLQKGGGMPEDILSALFGRRFNPFGHQQQRKTKANPIRHIHRVSLSQLATRATIKLKYQRKLCCSCFSSDNKCETCKGSGQQTITRQLGPGMIQQMVTGCQTCKGTGFNNGCEKCEGGFITEDHIAHVKLSPSMPVGYEYVCHAEGNQESPDLDTGDFVVKIMFPEQGSMYQVQGVHLICSKEITLKEALTGIQFELTHPAGHKIDVDTTGKVLKEGSVHEIDDQGLDQGGKMHIRFSVQFPETLNDEQIKTLKDVL